MTSDTPAPTVAYLNTRYPCLSHTFIEREVRALRRMGWGVRTFSVRPATARDRIGETHQEAARTTTVLMSSRRALLGELVRSVVGSPFRFWSGLRRAWSLTSPGRVAPVRALAAALQASRLVRELGDSGITHVHVHMANNGAVVAAAASAMNPTVSYSLSLHGASDFAAPTDSRLAAKIAGSSFVRCITSYARSQAMWAAQASDWPKLQVVHCGVFVSTAPEPRPPATRPIRLVSVGRLTPVKGHALLLDACRLLDARGVDWQLAVVGDGELRDVLEARVAAMRLQHRVHFAGPVGQEHLGDVYAGSDVLVVSSFMEGLPVVLMEAMERGVLCVAPKLAGIPELVEDGVTGWLATPGDAASLADAMAKAAAAALTDASSVRAAARRRIEQEFDAETNAASLAQVLARVVLSARSSERRQIPDALAHPA